MECSYVHDQANRVRRLETGRASIGLDWSKEGHLLGVEVGSAVHYTQAFDEIGRMTLQRLRTGSASDQFERAYTYDEASNLVERRDSQRGPSRFLYDRSGQLVGAEIPEFGKTSFSYDPAGNLTRFGDSERLQIEKGNRYRSSAERRLEYDSEGSITFLQERDEVAGWRFEYDTENRLRRGLRRTDTGDTLETIEFAYDAVGRRVLKRHNDRMTSYCWDGHLLAGEMTDGTDGEFTSYHFQPDSDFVPFLRETDSSVHLFVNDQLGVPQEIVDLDGELRWRGSYHPFGELLTQQCSAGVVSNPFRFPGQYFDEETGLCYNRNRYYDPKSGRYLTQDPIGLAGGLNPYAYALNPILWLDPLGLYDLALGRTRVTDGSNLRSFANSHNASTWTDLGFDGSRGMRQELERIIDGADSIHFNLTDLDVERALRDGHLGPEGKVKNITNWELWHVQQDWDKFKDKVTFWKDGKKVDPPFKCS
jgi:RHS repeat-associated protein